MNQKINSTTIEDQYIRNERDIDVFKLKDMPGINIVRSYAKNKADLKMFIKFALIEADGKLHVIGGVDTVKNKQEGDEGWVITSTKKTSAFRFYDDENIIFDKRNFQITFKNKSYTITDFITFLERNHMRAHMFTFSKFKNNLRHQYFKFIFWLVDKKLRREDFLFNLNKDRYFEVKSLKRTPKENKDRDPVFGYFKINKNLLIITLFTILPCIWLLQSEISDGSFSVSNPFWLFLSILIFFILEKINKKILNFVDNGDKIRALIVSTLDLKGNLKK